MKIEELSIGDWVLCDGECWKISAVNEDSVGLRVDSDYSVASLEECDPIEITSDILEENGFSLCDGCTSRWELECGVCWIKVTAPENYADVTVYKKVAHGYRRVIDEMQITGVHQLQHILRLVGVRKEVKLW